MLPGGFSRSCTRCCHDRTGSKGLFAPVIRMSTNAALLRTTSEYDPSEEGTACLPCTGYEKRKSSSIYIDPPYNTDNEGWVYNDNVNDPRIQKWLHQVVGKEGEDLSRHDKWLCMMYPRLKLLHRLPEIAGRGIGLGEKSSVDKASASSSVPAGHFQPTGKAFSRPLEQDPPEGFLVVEVEAVPDCGVGAEGSVGIFCH